ncbi:hypothetical protein Bca52824_007983 [Brassica carinata]|uniref:Uncharacterized protein n=1 Tax=Brassica carinata TaxID=52824 RepID=A0A8X8B7L0_BRACI|nr:hypothetical protein Bca52824_007983 [Brassica carinata]
MASSHFLQHLLLCCILCSIGGERPRRTQRQSRGLFVSDLPAVVSPQMVSSPTMSREDSLATAVFWFLGRVPNEPRSSSCRTEHSSYLTSSSLPSLVRTEPLIILCFALFQLSGIRSQISTRPDLNFLDVSSLYSSPKVVLSALAWILLNGCTVFLRRISGDFSYGTVKQPKSDAFCSEQVRCNGLLFIYDWAWPIRTTQPASPSRNSPNRSFPKPKFKNEKAFQIITVFGDRISLAEIFGVLTSVLSRPSSSSEETLLPPYPFPMEIGVSSVLVPSLCFSFLIVLSSCVAVTTEPEDAIETTSVVLVDEVLTSTSHYVTILQLSEFVVKALLTHSSTVSNLLLSSVEDLSYLAYLCVVCYAYGQR